jgi:hypothetical protein
MGWLEDLKSAELHWLFVMASTLNKPNRILKLN